VREQQQESIMAIAIAITKDENAVVGTSDIQDSVHGELVEP